MRRVERERTYRISALEAAGAVRGGGQSGAVPRDVALTPSVAP
ncbi:MAG TPA: hypothetical protein VD834_02855 [Blastococcus sp.]|nr:hypothetical protein [Blastococcus sp.]